MSTAGNQNARWGEVGENEACARYPAFVSVPDSVATWHDARVDEEFTAVVDGREVVVEAGTPVEAKAASYRVADGNSWRRGRVKIKRANHDELLANGGLYAVLVYNPNSRPTTGAFVAARLVSAQAVDERVGNDWSRDETYAEEADTVSWATFVDPSTVDPSGGVRR